MSEKKEKYLSPVGKAKFTYLNKPDTSMNQAGKYKVSIELDPNVDVNKKFILGLSTDTEAKYPQGHKPYKKDTDREGRETGNILITFSSSYKARIFDIYGREIPKDIFVGNGSMVQVCYMKSYYEVSGNKGMTLYLQAVKVIELIEPKEMTANDYGFETEEVPQDEDFTGIVGNEIEDTNDLDGEIDQEIPF